MLLKCTPTQSCMPIQKCTVKSYIHTEDHLVNEQPPICKIITMKHPLPSKEKNETPLKTPLPKQKKIL